MDEGRGQNTDGRIHARGFWRIPDEEHQGVQGTKGSLRKGEGNNILREEILILMADSKSKQLDSVGLALVDIKITLMNLYPYPLDSIPVLKEGTNNIKIENWKKLVKYLTIVGMIDKKMFDSLFWLIFVILFQEHNKQEIKVTPNSL